MKVVTFSEVGELCGEHRFDVLEVSRENSAAASKVGVYSERSCAVAAASEGFLVPLKRAM